MPPPCATICDRVRVLRGELLLERDVARSRGHVGRQGRDAALADVEAEDRRREQSITATPSPRLSAGPPLDAADDPAPEAALGGVGATEVPAEDRDAQRVDTVAEEGEETRAGA